MARWIAVAVGLALVAAGVFVITSGSGEEAAPVASVPTTAIADCEDTIGTREASAESLIACYEAAGAPLDECTNSVRGPLVDEDETEPIVVVNHGEARCIISPSLSSTGTMRENAALIRDLTGLRLTSAELRDQLGLPKETGFCFEIDGRAARAIDTVRTCLGSRG